MELQSYITVSWQGPQKYRRRRLKDRLTRDVLHVNQFVIPVQFPNVPLPVDDYASPPVVDSRLLWEEDQVLATGDAKIGVGESERLWDIACSLDQSANCVLLDSYEAFVLVDGVEEAKRIGSRVGVAVDRDVGRATVENRTGRRWACTGVQVHFVEAPQQGFGCVCVADDGLDDLQSLLDGPVVDIVVVKQRLEMHSRRNAGA